MITFLRWCIIRTSNEDLDEPLKYIFHCAFLCITSILFKDSCRNVGKLGRLCIHSPEIYSLSRNKAHNLFWKCPFLQILLFSKCVCYNIYIYIQHIHIYFYIFFISHYFIESYYVNFSVTIQSTHLPTVIIITSSFLTFISSITAFAGTIMKLNSIGNNGRLCHLPVFSMTATNCFSINLWLHLF